ncbi:hypothetical protein, partial [Bifidobacterium bombi]|uniref:hypothetical protein n=1 Tax=Bifidobacterium bombi TaxID=471511 RepID=UPI0019D39161
MKQESYYPPIQRHKQKAGLTQIQVVHDMIKTTEHPVVQPHVKRAGQHPRITDTSGKTTLIKHIKLTIRLISGNR